METTRRKKILWIDDDYQKLKGFLRKVADEGVDVEDMQVLHWKVIAC